MAVYKSLQEERAEARHQKHLAFANNTAWQMVGFAEQAIQYRDDTDGAKVPKPLYRSLLHSPTKLNGITCSAHALYVTCACRLKATA